MESESTALSTPPKPKRFWRTLVFQYLMAVFFVGGLESLCLMDWRGLFWAVPLLAVLRFHGAICRRMLPERLAIFGFLGGLLFVWLPLHCAIWMFWLNPLQISKETTYITEPLVADGSRPYYYSALEQRVTPKNPPEENGFRLMAEKLGPQIVGCDPDSAHSDWEKQRRMEKWETICSKLRIDPSTKAVLTFRALRMYLEEHEKSVNPQPDRKEQWDAYREWDKNLNEKVISLSPPEGKTWTAEEFPLAAHWIEEQNAVFDLFAEAVQEPVFFRPFAWDGEGDSLFHNLDLRSLVVHVAVAMRSRILFRLGKSETEAAWQDVLALYRYAAHNRENAFMRFDLESGYMLSELAARDVLRYGNVSREQIVRFQADLQRFRVPLEQKIIDQIVFGERIYSLDEGLTPIYITTSSETSNTVYLFRLLSWNHELIGLNKRYDAHIGRPLPVIYEKYTETPSRPVVDFSYYLLWKGIFKAIPNLAAAGKVRMCLCRPFPIHLDSRTRIMQQCITDLMALLIRYRSEYNEYPESLVDLMQFDDNIQLTDLFNEPALLKYRVTEPDGFLLYSIGPNGIDDSGVEDLQKWKDDISIQMP